MLLGLARAVYDLGYTLTDAPVEIHLCVVFYLLKRLHFQSERRIVRAEAPVRDLIKKFCQFMLIHGILLF